jgi:hypothetical protein
MTPEALGHLGAGFVAGVIASITAAVGLLNLRLTRRNLEHDLEAPTSVAAPMTTPRSVRFSSHSASPNLKVSFSSRLSQLRGSSRAVRRGGETDALDGPARVADMRDVRGQLRHIGVGVHVDELTRMLQPLVE